MSSIHKSAIIPETLGGMRIDQAVAAMFPDYSRNRLKGWILAGDLRIDGQTLRPRDKIAGGEQVTLDATVTADSAHRPQALALATVFEDEHLLIIDKPAGLVVHPGAGNPDQTLLNGLLALDPALAELPRAGIVHRLDKNTSGLLLVARTLESHTALTKLLSERRIAREYRAICCGVLTGGGTVDAAIGRHPRTRTRMAVRTDGRPAVTHYRVLHRYVAHTDIRVILETGRTHQIRVHMAHRGHALFGDPVYGGRLRLPPRATDALTDLLRGFRRQALHAAKLEFDHPITGETLSCETPLPADHRALVDALAKHAQSLTRDD